MRARAMAMRWRWPPENSMGFRSSWAPLSPTSSIAAWAARRRAGASSVEWLRLKPAVKMEKIERRGLSDLAGS